MWSQIDPEEADNNLGTTATDLPHRGSVSYSPLQPVPADDISSLNSVADCEGRTLAVHHTTGDLCEGPMRLVVEGGDTAPAVRSTITDLRGVAGSRPCFTHGTQDARCVFFNGITAVGGALTGTPTMSVRYWNSSRDPDVDNAPTTDGVLVRDAVFTDEPVGVLGPSAIPSGSDIDAFSASF